MTVIAWDGRMLAADKRACNGTSSVGTVTKIHRWSGGLCGFAGDLDLGLAMAKWLEDGAIPANYPERQKGDDNIGFIVVHNNGTVVRYEREPVPIRFENRFQAMGSGRDFALAAMHLGWSARNAVVVACALDCGCGNGIDVLCIEAGPGEAPCSDCGGPLKPDEVEHYGNRCEVCEGIVSAQMDAA